MIRKPIKTGFFISFLSIAIYGYSQSLDQARIMFDEGRYGEAKPVYERLVRQSPNNSAYNQSYGVCCYETKDYENAEKYLLIANRRNVQESNRYLAMLYTDLYRFSEAIGMWEKYIELQKRQRGDTSESEKQLTLVRNLNRMQENTEDVQIIDSTVIHKSVFLEVYSLSEESGMLVAYNDFFRSANPVSSIVHTNQKGSVIYYARPAENGAYAIFSQSKLLDAWGDEKPLLSNTGNDNNYPFVLSDGITMYFASKGYESIGGYDIFRTRYNSNTNSYLVPEQMGMPFNSPANDYMMVMDESKGLGWFVSDRNQPEDYVCVYLFIPEPVRKRIDNTENEAELRNRSALVSIRDTWKEGMDYSKLIALAHEDMTQKEAKREHDFDFFINDQVTYTTLNEIKSHEAKELYTEVLSINRQIETLRIRLNEIRNTYAEANPSIRTQLKATILQAENQLYSLMEKADVQEKKARNAEIRQTGIK